MDSGMREKAADLREAFRRKPAEEGLNRMEKCMVIMRRTHPLRYLRITGRLGSPRDSAGFNQS